MAIAIPCGPCGYEDSVKNAKKWCTNCEEGFCEYCEKVHRSTKMSRNHTLISVSDYQKIKDVSINQTCVGHGKRYDLYCSMHDKPLCIDCVDQHKNCSKLVSLDAVAANAKQSTAMADLEDTINGALQNVDKCIKNLETSEKEFDKQESLIKKTIQKTREKLNQHLDLLEQNLIQNLSTKTINCKSACAEVLRHMNMADKKFSQLKEEMANMKEMASDIQVFLGTREIHKTVSEEIKSIKDIINSAKYFEIKIEINPSITALLDCVDRLGIISVNERNLELEFKDVKLDQAQRQIYLPTGSSNRVVGLQLKHKFRTSREGAGACVSGCLILPNGNILIADFARDKTIREYDGQGQYLRNIICSAPPYYLTLIDPDRIAITCFQTNMIEIIHLSDTRVQKIKTSNECKGISYEDGKLFVVENSIGIVVLDLSGKILYTVPIATEHLCMIATSQDRIYYTNKNENTIHCLSLKGQEIWEYHHKHIVQPRGVAVSENKDVFVVGYESSNLFIIEQNGQESKILLNEPDDWNNPRAVYYSKDRKELLICSEYDGTAAVYKVITVSRLCSIDRKLSTLHNGSLKNYACFLFCYDEVEKARLMRAASGCVNNILVCNHASFKETTNGETSANEQEIVVTCTRLVIFLLKKRCTGDSILLWETDGWNNQSAVYIVIKNLSLPLLEGSPTHEKQLGLIMNEKETNGLSCLFKSLF